jgi:UDP:flavonoid glycosyltransferase YjiC (YdhE family)
MICLLPNCCFLSETSRIVEIHQALTARGAAVRVATQGGPHEWVLRDAGIPYDVLGPGMDDRRAAAFVAAIPGIGAPDQSMWSDDELRAYVAAEVAYFHEHDIRVAVTGWTLTALLSTRVAGIPLVTEHAGAYVPPVWERGGLPEPSRPIGLPLERILPARLRRWLANQAPERLDLYLGGFNRIAAELGVPRIPSLASLLLSDLSLVTEVPEVLGVTRDAIDSWTPRRPAGYRDGTRLRCTGPLYARFDLPVPERVRDFLAGPGQTVYVAITSSPAELVRSVVAGLRPLGVRVLVAATVHELADLEDDRVMVERVLPNHEVMPLADLVVIAGGQGSVQTAAASGTPFIGLPLQPEQDTNVVLVERLGAGRRLATPKAGTPALTRLARAMLADPRYAASAARLRTLYSTVDGAASAADAILELLATGAGERDAGPAAVGERGTG